MKYEIGGLFFVVPTGTKNSFFDFKLCKELTACLGLKVRYSVQSRIQAGRGSGRPDPGFVLQ